MSVHSRVISFMTGYICSWRLLLLVRVAELCGSRLAQVRTRTLSSASMLRIFPDVNQKVVAPAVVEGWLNDRFPHPHIIPYAVLPLEDATVAPLCRASIEVRNRVTQNQRFLRLGYCRTCCTAGTPQVGLYLFAVAGRPWILRERTGLGTLFRD